MPASYPAAVKTFATRSNGATIDASHVQDLQDEVTAIEAGLLNGTAPLNSSGSTMIFLNVLGGSTFLNVRVTGLSSFAGTVHVTGNSTLAGSLNVTGNSTFTGTVNFTGAVTGLSPASIHRVRVSHSAVQQLPNNAWTGLNWDTHIYDSTGMHSTTTNSSRITFTGSTGIYQVGACIPLSTGTAGVSGLQIRFNDSSQCVRVTGVIDNTVPNSLMASCDVRVGSTSDYVTVLVNYVNSTGRVPAESTGAALGFWAHFLST